MSKQSEGWGKLSYLIIGISVILACSTIVPSKINSTDTEPTKKIIKDTPMHRLTVATRPASLPSQHPPGSQATKIFHAPTDTIPIQIDMSDACTLAFPNEISALFSTLPTPSTRRVQTANGDWGSICKFTNEDVTIEIWMLDFPDYSEFNDVMNNMKTTPDFVQFSDLDSNIYQTLWHISESPPGQSLIAVILKGDLEVQFFGTSGSYKYDRDRESLFLLKIAGRLPSIKSLRTPCSLVTVNELSTLFPNPPVPNNDINKDKEYPVSICKFKNDAVEFTISIAENPDLARQLSKDIEMAMSQVTYISHFATSNADIYQMGGQIDESRVEDVFHAIILKNNISIQVAGSGKSYQYNVEREALLLEAIAGRLP